MNLLKRRGVCGSDNSQSSVIGISSCQDMRKKKGTGSREVSGSRIGRSVFGVHSKFICRGRNGDGIKF